MKFLKNSLFQLVFGVSLLLFSFGCEEKTQDATPVEEEMDKPLGIELTEVWAVLTDQDGGLNTHTEHPSSAESAEFSPDETLIATVAKGDNSIRLVNAETGEEIWHIYADAETEAITFTKDNNYIITGGEDKKIRVISVEDGEVLKVLNDIASIEGLRMSHDGKWLATGNEAGLVKIWATDASDPKEWADAPAYTLIHGEDQDHPDYDGSDKHSDVNQVDWTEDDRFVVSSGRNAATKIWEMTTIQSGSQQPYRAWKAFSSSSKAVRLSPGDTLVAAGAQRSPDGAAAVWNVESGELIQKIDLPNIRIVETVEFTPNGQFLLVGGTEKREAGDGKIYFYLVESLYSNAQPEPVKVIEVFNQEYFHFKKDGSQLVVAHADGMLRLYDVAYL